MNPLKITSLAFAALLSVCAHAQIVTNYGQNYLYDDGPWAGNWAGSGEAANNGTFLWAAQTFTAPTNGPVYAYNVQLKALGTATPSFTTAIYEWTGTGLGNLVADSTSFFHLNTNADFQPEGSNTAIKGGAGSASLNAGSLYAIVIHRTDGGPGTAQIGTVSSPFNTYTGGEAYYSTNGTSYTPFGGTTDLAFWVSFDPNSLSPVPEPAVNGAIIGAAFVTGLVVWRRRQKKAAAETPVAA